MAFLARCSAVRSQRIRPESLTDLPGRIIRRSRTGAIRRQPNRALTGPDRPRRVPEPACRPSAPEPEAISCPNLPLALRP